MRFTKRVSPAALLGLGDFRRWRRTVAPVPIMVEAITLTGESITTELVELHPARAPKLHDDRDAARGIVQSAIVLILGYTILGLVLATVLTGCGGGGGGGESQSQKPAAVAPPPTTPAPPSTPPTVEPGVFKTSGFYCLVLPPGTDGACRIGESDSRWLAASDVNAVRVAAVHFAHVDGTYSGTLDGVPMTVSVVGATLTGQSASGCSVNGAWTTASGALFEFTGSASCAGGVQLAGLIAFASADGSTSNGVKILLAARGGSDSHITFIADGAPNATPTPTDCSSRPKPADDMRFTSCPSGTGPGSFVQTRQAVCSSPPEWSWGPWSPASPSASECPPIVVAPPTCGAAPPDGVRTSTECPAGLQGSWEQRHTWSQAAYPQCWTPNAWTPDSAPADACQLPPPPLFGMHGRWGWPGSAEFCDIQPAGTLHCVLSYNSASQIMDGSVLPGGVGTTRSFRDGVFGPARDWQFLAWSTDANGNTLTLSFAGAGAPPGAGVLAEMKRVTP